MWEALKGLTGVLSKSDWFRFAQCYVVKDMELDWIDFNCPLSSCNFLCAGGVPIGENETAESQATYTGLKP